jgi:NitT/TauT family transport system substrate-binding protein
MLFYKLKHYLILSLFVFITLLSACQPRQEPLRIALLEWPPYELAFWARENNWFTNEQVVLLEYKTPAEVARAFTTGAVDIIALTSDFALTLSEEYPDTRIIVVIDSSNGGDSVLSKQPLKRGDNFKGKRIGLESGPLGSYMLSRFMEKFAIKESDLTIKYVDIPAQLNMWQAEAIDLLITYDPIRSKLKSQGAFEIFNTREIPNEIIDVFLMREKQIETQQAHLKAFLSGWFKAVEDLKRKNPLVYQFIGEREDIASEVIQEIFNDISVPSLSENISLLSDKNTFIANLKQHEKVMLKKKLMSKTVDKEPLVTNQALQLLESK